MLSLMSRAACFVPICNFMMYVVIEWQHKYVNELPDLVFFYFFYVTLCNIIDVPP